MIIQNTQNIRLPHSRLLAHLVYPPEMMIVSLPL
jgi:hypothetical protein